MQDTDALFQEGLRLYGEQRYDEAYPLLLQAAEGGHAQAYCVAGYCLFYGRGTAQDEMRAVLCFTEAAKAGDADALCRLGWCYYTAYGGVAQDLAYAAELFARAAAQGHPAAQNNLGLCCEHGRGVKKDLAAAIEWYRKAAARGNPDAIGNLERLGCR